MNKNLVVLSALATSLVSFTVMAQEPGPTADPGASVSPAAPAVTATAPTASGSNTQVGVNFLPMTLGRKTAADNSGVTTSGDLSLAYGVCLSASYTVLSGLSVGIAPQLVLNVKPKDASWDASKEYDLMARVAYAYSVATKIAVYGEFMPGYSIISVPNLPQGIDNPSGLVLAFGVGATLDITDQLFANLGVGYQMGFQKTTFLGMDFDGKTKFLRVAIGVGMKL